MSVFLAAHGFAFNAGGNESEAASPCFKPAVEMEVLGDKLLESYRRGSLEPRKKIAWTNLEYVFSSNFFPDSFSESHQIFRTF